MRIWDLPPEQLCDRHLLGEHRELHAVWTVITERKVGYARHPETERWRGRLRALYGRHKILVKELRRRGFQHRSPLEEALATGQARQDTFIDPPAIQRALLLSRDCACPRVPGEPSADK